MAQAQQSQQCSRCGLIVVVGQQVGSCYGGRLRRFSLIPVEGVGIDLRDHDRLEQAKAEAEAAALMKDHAEMQGRMGTGAGSSSVDTATAASPSQNILHGLQEQIGVSTPQTWVTGYDGVPAYGGIPRETQASGESSRQQAYVGNAVDYGYPKGVKVSGVPCPNCQALGPHMCPAHDGLRWAQQDELNAANASVMGKMQLQINCLQDASNNFAQQIADLRKMAEHPLINAACQPPQPALVGTPVGIGSSLACEFDGCNLAGGHKGPCTDHSLRAALHNPAQVGIGSDVSAAAAPSSPNYTNDRALCIRLDEYEVRLNRLAAAGDTVAGGMGSGWVSCADRLPDHKHPVLVYAPEYTVNVRIDICCGGNRRYWRSYGENVTHWMPLPPPPTATSAQPATTADRRNSDNDGGWISDIGG